MTLKLPDKVYNILKWVALVAIPSITTFIGVVFGALEVDPRISNIVLTILPAIGVLIASLIGISTYNYNKGLNVKED